MAEVLDDDDHLVRWFAAAHLDASFINSELPPWAHELVPALIKSLADDSGWVRESAAGGLFKLGSQASSALPALIERARVEESKRVLKDMVKAIGTTAGSSPAAIEVLIEILRREIDLPTIDAAVEALGHIGRDAVPALIVAMKGEDADLAREALRALWRIPEAISPGKPPMMLALPALMELADGDDEELRYLAVRGIGKLGWVAHESVPVLVQALKSPQLRTRRAAAWSLGQFANFAKESADALAPLRRDSDPRLRALATWAHRSVTREVP